MQQELDSSWKNLQNQKKFLNNCKFLYANKKPYQNDGMAETISKTEQLIEDIERIRFFESQYDIMFEFGSFIERILEPELKVPNEFETIHDWIDDMWFAQRYGGDVLGPVIITEMNAQPSTILYSQYKITYDDNGTVTTRELWKKP